MENPKTRDKAELIARDLLEYITSIDYQKYYDAMGRPGARGGDKEKQFSDFSIRAVDAAQVVLSSLIFLLPPRCMRRWRQFRAGSGKQHSDRTAVHAKQ